MGATLVSPPTDKAVEARHQTQHKLELMERYWGAWCSILARTRGMYRFCPAHLWLIDTHAGPGRHESAWDPDGEIPGTPMLAALAARSVQRAFPGLTIHVRATDKSEEIAKELHRRTRVLAGDPPDGVDIRIGPVDWARAVPWVIDEIAADDGHPHAGKAGAWEHEHRSLWFVDPFGVDGIDHAVIETFPPGSEVIVNLDLMAIMRHAGKATGGDAAAADILRRLFGDERWRQLHPDAARRQELADAYAQSFPQPKWRIRKAHLLRQTGSQHRAMIHLTNADRADEVFGQDVVRALKAGTIVAGTILAKQEKDAAAKRLRELFRGLTMTTREMRSVVATWDLGQLKTICRAAANADYGELTGDTMTWFEERQRPPGLFD